MSRFAFVGDGLYCGDGGAELQRLWEKHAWKALGGCDGRFVQRGSGLSSLSLSDLCDSWSVVTRTPVLRSVGDGEHDAFDCVRVRGGGGLLSYCKADGAYVHTLNTESGLARKLLALRGGTPVVRLVSALGDSLAAPLFASICALLARVPEPQRTTVAPALAASLRAVLARAATRSDKAAALFPSRPVATDVCGDCGVEGGRVAAPAPSEAAAASNAARESGMPRAPARRSIDFLLEGTSIRTNRHLQRFGRAHYLPQLIAHPAFESLLRRTSKVLKKELIEAFVAIEALEGLLTAAERARAATGAAEVANAHSKEESACTPDDGHAPRHDLPVVVDLCSGKGYLSLLLALEYPHLPIVAVDLNPKIKDEHYAAVPNLHFMRADILAPSFGADLEAAVDAALDGAAPGGDAASPAGDAGGDLCVSATAPPSSCIALGVHLCGPLSPRAIQLFDASPRMRALVLVPCCLDKRTDGELKASARVLRIDPYEAKTRQLASFLHGAHADVSVRRDEAMRTQGGAEGGAGCKNAVIVARKRSAEQQRRTCEAVVAVLDDEALLGRIIACLARQPRTDVARVAWVSGRLRHAVARCSADIARLAEPSPVQ